MQMIFSEGVNIIAAEKNFETKVKNYIENIGGWQVKFFANRMTKTGIPDLLACINGHFVAIEVKAQNGKPSELQLYQCEKIRKSGGFAFILYPSGFNKFQSFCTGLKIDKFNKEMEMILK